MVVFALVAYNAPACQLATKQISDGDDNVAGFGAEESDVGDDDRCCDAGPVCAGAPHRDADVTAALAREVSQCIFGIRFAAHSLQLVLKDLRGSVGSAQSAEKSVDRLAAQFCGAPSKEDRLRALQKNDDVATALLLAKPVATARISKVDAFWRALGLKIQVVSDHLRAAGQCLTDAE